MRGPTTTSSMQQGVKEIIEVLADSNALLLAVRSIIMCY